MTERKRTPADCFASVFTDCYKNLNRNIQRTEECFGHAGLTAVDEDIQRMLGEVGIIIKRHKRVISLVEQRLKHGPLAITREFIYEGAERKKYARTNEQYQLGSQLIFAGRALGDQTLFGKILINIGLAQQDLGHEELKFVTLTAISLLVPIRTYLDTRLHNAMRQQHILNNRRLDLDAALRRFHHENFGHDNRLQMQVRVDVAQVEFENQQQRTRAACLVVEGEKKRMVVAFLRFIECQLVYVRKCAGITESLKLELIRKLNTEDIPNLEWSAAKLNRDSAVADHSPMEEHNYELIGDDLNADHVAQNGDMNHNEESGPEAKLSGQISVAHHRTASGEDSKHTLPLLIGRPLTALKRTWEELKGVIGKKEEPTLTEARHVEHSSQPEVVAVGKQKTVTHNEHGPAVVEHEPSNADHLEQPVSEEKESFKTENASRMEGSQRYEHSVRDKAASDHHLPHDHAVPSSEPELNNPDQSDNK